MRGRTGCCWRMYGDSLVCAAEFVWIVAEAGEGWLVVAGGKDCEVTVSLWQLL